MSDPTHRAVVVVAIALTLATATVAPTVTASSAATAETQSDATATVEYGGDRVSLVNGPNATVSGTTTLDPGSQVTVRVRSSGASPFVVQGATAVADDGTFTVELDLSGAPVGANATVTVVGANETLATVDAVTVGDATLTHEGQRVSLPVGSNATVSGSTTLAADSEVVVRVRSAGENPFLKSQATTVAEDGTFHATFEFGEQAAGANATVSVHDADGTLTEANAVLVQATTETPYDSPTQSPTPFDSPMPGNQTTDGDETTPDGSSGDGPGFGVVGGLLALVAGGLLATRRD
jgi:PGF-CTERM protein